MHFINPEMNERFCEDCANLEAAMFPSKKPRRLAASIRRRKYKRRAGSPVTGGLDVYGCHNNRRAGGYHCHRGPTSQGNRSAQRKRCSRNYQQRILIEKSRQMLRTKAKSPSERKEPPTPKKPPIKSLRKSKSLSVIRHRREHQNEWCFKAISGFDMASICPQLSAV